MSLLLSFDPGVNCPGAGLFDIETKQLRAARYFKGEGFRDQLGNVVQLAREVYAWGRSFGDITVFVSEWQELRGRADVKAIESQAPLWAITGALGALLYDCWHHVYRPSEWKGSKKKNATARWVLATLRPTEASQILHIDSFRAALSTAGLKDCTHKTMNAVEAVGVGLKHLGRLDRVRVIERNPPPLPEVSL